VGGLNKLPIELATATGPSRTVLFAAILFSLKNYATNVPAFPAGKRLTLK
jgi:hypothetical protein